MATIFKRGGSWEVQVRRVGLPTSTKRFKRKLDAEAWATSQEASIPSGAYAEQKLLDQFRLDDLLDRYQKEITPGKKSRVTEASQITLLRSQPLAQLRLPELTASRFAEWRDMRLESVSGSTVNRNLNLISHVINVARREWGLQILNPIPDVRRPKNNRGRRAHLTQEQESRLLSALAVSERRPDGTLGAGTRNPWMYSIVSLAIETGMRRGELLSMRWRDVDFDLRVVHLYDTKNSEDRDVPLSPRALATLEPLKGEPHAFVFPTSPEAVKKAFARAAKAAGMEELRFHDLRHIATTRLSRKLSVLELSAVTGHKTLSMLQRYYHPDAAQLAKKLID